MADTTQKQPDDVEKIRDEWIRRLSQLVVDVKGWAENLGWATKRIEITKQDSIIGTYQAPALLMQKEAARVLLEPISRSAPGYDGVVDLYLIPAYDDIATILFHVDHWQLHYMFPGMTGLSMVEEAPAKPLDERSLSEILEAMLADVSQDSPR
jgi:hypothetical protein